MLSFSDGLGHEPPCESEIRYRAFFSLSFWDLPPSIPSTALLPVLITKTRLRFSWSSRPVANEHPLFWIYYGILMTKMK